MAKPIEQWLEPNDPGASQIGETIFSVEVNKLQVPALGNEAVFALLNGQAQDMKKLDPTDPESTEALCAKWGKAYELDPGDIKRALYEALRMASAVVKDEIDDDAGEDGNDKLTQSAELILYAEDEEVHMFTEPDRDPYVTLTIDGHHETFSLRGKDFRLWLTRKYYENHSKPPGSQALQDAIDTLTAKAIFEGERHPVHVRLAEADGKIYLDLCDDGWRVVEIDADGWRVLDKSPIKFIRKNGMQALPEPITGGSLDALRPLVNVPDDELWRLLLTWIIGALRPTGPYGVLILHGEAGSCKSTLTRVLRKLIDANKAALRPKPKSEHDLVIAASNSWVCAFDNLSYVDQDLSDALCRLATGSGYGTRLLYSNGEEMLFDVQRPVILNSVGETVTKTDLLDRGVMLQLPYVPDENRLDERELWTKFEEISGGVLGALLSALSMALKNYESIELTSKPRMADFAKWGAAAAPALGWDQEKFLKAYKSNRNNAQSTALEASGDLSDLITDFINGKSGWEGLTSDLLEGLRNIATEEQRRAKWFPTKREKLGKDLTYIAPVMRRMGINVVSTHAKKGTKWNISRVQNSDKKEGREPGGEDFGAVYV